MAEDPDRHPERATPAPNARLEESRDGFRPQEDECTNTYRWLLPRLFHPQPDGVLDRRRLRGGA